MEQHTSILENPIVYAIRKGLVLSIPLLMIGSFSLVFKFLPIGFYQRFITSFASGFLVNLFTGINMVTFGILSICIVLCISYAYASLCTLKTGEILGALMSSLSAYMIFVAFLTDDFKLQSFGAHGMFTAIFSATVFTAIYCKLLKRNSFSFKLYTVGADVDFNTVILICIPTGATVLLAYLLNLFINITFDVVGLEALFHKAVYLIFNLVDSYSAKAVMYVVISNIFWLFGIHGTNALFNVEELIFGAQQGLFTKKFIDVFVLMGGCGTTISLLVAILLFSKQHSTRTLGKYSAIPMVFNINEMMVFGLPITFNTTFFIPFLATPVFCIISAYTALRLGIVPPPANDVSWVMPVIINGYQSTGSIAGSFLQIFNIAGGAFIYRWFLLRYEEKTDRRVKKDFEELLHCYKAAEKDNEVITLLELPGRVGAIARTIASDLRHVLTAKDSLELFYQPQYNSDNDCIGAEALLRWAHPRFGMIYPPLLTEIAKESRLLSLLEHEIFNMACADIKTLQDIGLCPEKISVNATAVTLYDNNFMGFLREKADQYPDIRNVLCIELTEQMSFMFSNEIEKKLNEIRAMGIRFAVDDFSMGHTSIKYLQSNLFDLVKLDGSLVKDMMVNSRSEEIVASIVQMSKTMHFNVIAEFVETVEHKRKLESYGCHLFQGYLYSPAIPLDQFIELLNRPFH